MAGGRSTPRPDPDRSASGGRFTLRVGGQELTIGHGIAVIGRSEDCAIRVNDELVSRKHARIIVDENRIYIEDLGSANGTFVNQARLVGRVALLPGDHIFVGTREIEILHPDPSSLRAAVEIGSPGRARMESSSSVSASSASSSGQRAAVERFEAAASRDTTTEVDAFEYLSRLADKMFTMGRIEAARRILESNLQEILNNARGGGSPRPALVDAAGRSALKLAAQTMDGRWIDMAIELHLLVERPLRKETTQALAALRERVRFGDEALLTRYAERLWERMTALGPEERDLCVRVARLVRPANTP